MSPSSPCSSYLARPRGAQTTPSLSDSRFLNSKPIDAITPDPSPRFASRRPLFLSTRRLRRAPTLLGPLSYVFSPQPCLASPPISCGPRWPHACPHAYTTLRYNRYSTSSRMTVTLSSFSQPAPRYLFARYSLPPPLAMEIKRCLIFMLLQGRNE